MGWRAGTCYLFVAQREVPSRISAISLIIFYSFPSKPQAGLPAPHTCFNPEQKSCGLMKAVRFWGFSGGALTWHRCLPTQRGSRNTEGNPYKKTQSLFPSGVSIEVESLQELPRVVWHPPSPSGLSIISMPWDSMLLQVSSFLTIGNFHLFFSGQSPCSHTTELLFPPFVLWHTHSCPRAPN